MHANVSLDGSPGRRSGQKRDRVMRLKSTAVMAVFLIAFCSGASAADLGMPPAIPASEGPFEFGTGWYLRGDIGYAFNNKTGIEYGGLPLTNTKINNTWSAGGGFGYKFNNWFRADITAEYRNDATATGIGQFANT